MEVPKTAKGWWRADMQSSNLTEFPFYKCLPGRCQGNANGSNTSCNTGYDENGPKCSTCATHYYMANEECIYCKSRLQTSAASSSLVVIIVVCILLYLIGGWSVQLQNAAPKQKERGGMLTLFVSLILFFLFLFLFSFQFPFKKVSIFHAPLFHKTSTNESIVLSATLLPSVQVLMLMVSWIAHHF